LEGLALGADEEAQVLAGDGQLDGAVLPAGGGHLALELEGVEEVEQELAHHLSLGKLLGLGHLGGLLVLGSGRAAAAARATAAGRRGGRSEERRVGKECRSRWVAYLSIILAGSVFWLIGRRHSITNNMTNQEPS